MRDADDHGWALATVGLLLLALALPDCPAPRRAARTLDAGTRRTLAAALIAEANTSRRDWAAIAHVLARRARRHGVPLAQMTRRYCAAWRARRARAARMRAIGRDRPDPRLRSALRFVDRWAAGRVPDPCRGRAWHWGSPSDTPRGRMRRINCGRTANIFYTLDRR